MPVSDYRPWVAAFCLMAMMTPVFADEALPEVEFLEYLGSWVGDDEEWLVIAEESESDRERDAVDVDTKENDDAKDDTDS